MKDAINYLADNYDVEIQSMKVMPDHVHLLVSFKPKLAPADVVKILKGSSARMVHGSPRNEAQTVGWSLVVFQLLRWYVG